MYVTPILHCNLYVLWAGGLQLQNEVFVLYCIVLLRGQDLGSDCASSWLLFIFSFINQAGNHLSKSLKSTLTCLTG